MTRALQALVRGGGGMLIADVVAKVKKGRKKHSMLKVFFVNLHAMKKCCTFFLYWMWMEKSLMTPVKATVAHQAQVPSFEMF